MVRVLAFALAALALAAGGASAQVWELTLSPQSVRPRVVALERGWLFQSGDDPAWAAPGLDDRGWRRVESSSLAGSPPPGWAGAGWFRLRVNVAPEIADRPFRLQLRHPGASEVYMDGERVARFGLIGDRVSPDIPFDANTPPPIISFPGEGSHVLAIRYSYRNDKRGNPLPAEEAVKAGVGIWLELQEPLPQVRTGATWHRMLALEALAGLLLAFGLQQAVAYYTGARRRVRAYFAFFALAWGLALGVSVAAVPANGSPASPAALTLTVLFGLGCVALVALTFHEIAGKVPAVVVPIGLALVGLLGAVGMFVGNQFLYFVARIAAAVLVYLGFGAAFAYAKKLKLKITRRPALALSALALAPASVFLDSVVPSVSPLGLVLAWIFVVMGLIELSSVLSPMKGRRRAPGTASEGDGADPKLRPAWTRRSTGGLSADAPGVAGEDGEEEPSGDSSDEEPPDHAAATKPT
jgi:hypothetical protein